MGARSLSTVKLESGFVLCKQIVGRGFFVGQARGARKQCTPCVHVHTATCACMCIYLHHSILCQNVLLSYRKVADPAGRILSSEIAACYHLIFQLKMATFFLQTVSNQFLWPEFSCTVAFQLLRLLRFHEVFLSSVNTHCTRNLAGAYSLTLLAAEAAFSRRRVQSMKPFINALPLSSNTAYIYQKGRAPFLFLGVILDFN